MSQENRRLLHLSPAALTVGALHAGLIVALLTALDRGNPLPAVPRIETFNVVQRIHPHPPIRKAAPIRFEAPTPDPTPPGPPSVDEARIMSPGVARPLNEQQRGPTVAGGPVWSHPQVLSRTDVEYPWRARMLEEEGVVELAIRIGVDGSPREIRVARSSGHAQLDAAACSAVTHWQFRPLMRDGSPVEAWARLPITFRLENY